MPLPRGSGEFELNACNVRSTRTARLVTHVNPGTPLGILVWFLSGLVHEKPAQGEGRTDRPGLIRN